MSSDHETEFQFFKTMDERQPLISSERSYLYQGSRRREDRVQIVRFFISINFHLKLMHALMFTLCVVWIRPRYICVVNVKIVFIYDMIT